MQKAKYLTVKELSFRLLPAALPWELDVDWSACAPSSEAGVKRKDDIIFMSILCIKLAHIRASKHVLRRKQD